MSAASTIERSLNKLVQRRLSQADADAARACRSPPTARPAPRPTSWSRPSRKFELKQSIFEALDSICGRDTILASNTSSISITKIAACTSRPEKVIGMHFMNPVPLMKLVGVDGELTSSETNATVVAAAEAMGKTPLTSQDYPGFISSRILPMLNEAIICLQEGVATKEAIDGIMKLGMNHPMGPLTLADFIGLDTVLHIMDVLPRASASEVPRCAAAAWSTLACLGASLGVVYSYN